MQVSAERLPADDLVVYAPSWDGAARIRCGATVPGLPAPDVADAAGAVGRRRAAELIAEHRLRAVWYGAAAPLSLLTPALRAEGVHAHGGQHARARGRLVDAARRAPGAAPDRPHATTSSPSSATTRGGGSRPPSGRRRRWSTCRPASTSTPSGPTRRPGDDCATSTGSATGRCCCAVSRLVRRKGQDALIQALPPIRAAVPDALVLIVGDGRTGRRLRDRVERARRRRQRAARRVGAVRRSARHYARPTSSPCRAGPGVAGWTSRAWGSSSWRRRPAACRWSPATPAERRRPSSRAAPGRWSTAGTPKPLRCAMHRPARPTGRAVPGLGERTDGEWVRRPWNWDSIGRALGAVAERLTASALGPTSESLTDGSHRAR